MELDFPLSNIQQAGALTIFALYFALIAWLTSVVFRSIQLARSQSHGANKDGWKLWLFSFLSLGSFAHTWFYMFKFMFWSFAEYESHHSTLPNSLLERVANWLVNTPLFKEAWTLVSFGGVNWWWSEQLCLFTVGAWTVFLYEQGSRYQIKHVWAYTLLGQAVAISVASNLFILAIISSTPQPRSRSKPENLPPSLWIPVILSICTVALSPFTGATSFLPNLLIMHLLITIPLISQPSFSSASKLTLSRETVYLLIFLLSLPIRSRSILTALASLPTSTHSRAAGDQSPYALFEEAWRVLHWNPAQSSIGWDVVWTTISFIVWTASSSHTNDNARSRWFSLPYLIVASPFASIGVTAPYVLRTLSKPAADKEE